LLADLLFDESLGVRIEGVGIDARLNDVEYARSEIKDSGEDAAERKSRQQFAHHLLLLCLPSAICLCISSLEDGGDHGSVGRQHGLRKVRIILRHAS